MYLHYSRTGNVTGHGLAGQRGMATGARLWPLQFGDDGNKPRMFQHPRDRGVPKKNACGDLETERDRLPAFGFGSMGLHPNSSSSSSSSPALPSPPPAALSPRRTEPRVLPNSARHRRRRPPCSDSSGDARSRPWTPRIARRSSSPCRHPPASWTPAPLRW